MIRATPFRNQRRWVTATLHALVVAVAAGQPAPRPNAEEKYQVDAVGSERAIWVAKVGRAGSLLFSRTAGEPFDMGRALDRRIAALVALDQELLCFLEGGAVYRYSQAQLEPAPETSLAGWAPVIDAVGEGGVTYALVESEVARQVASAPAEGRTGSGGLLSVVRYEGREWRFIADCPEGARSSSTAARPRLALAGERLSLYWHNARRGQIDGVSRRISDDLWSAEPPLETPRPSGLWATHFGGVLTLVVSVGDEGGQAGGAEKLSAYRLLPDNDGSGASWRAAKLQVSESDAAIISYQRAFGFNQQLALLGLDAQGDAHLLFARAAEPPTDRSLRVRDLLAGPSEARRLQELWSQVAFLLLLVVLTGLFALRRESITKEALLPSNAQLALRLQRGAAWLIDFTPFTVACAVIIGVPWWESLREVGGWALNPDPQAGLPPLKVLGWWAASCATHATYCAVMEWLTRRTVGKALLGMSLLSESGGAATLGQILARNGLRLIELIPQFWIFVVLLFASRNRQRLGDIFARTIVVRGGGRPTPQRRPPEDAPDEDDLRPT